MTLVAGSLLCAQPTPTQPPPKTFELAKERNRQDQTTWAHEVEAQEYEAVIIAFWDRLRNTAVPQRKSVFEQLALPKISLGPVQSEKANLGLGIEKEIVTRALGKAPNYFNATQWKQWLSKMTKQGYHLAQSEWHHHGFTPATKSTTARSLVSFELHLVQPGQSLRATIVKGELALSWRARVKDSPPQLASALLRNCTIVRRTGSPLFQKSMRIAPDEARKGEGVSLSPVIVQDLNGDRYPEIILGGVNSIFWNQGAFKFERRPLFTKAKTMRNTGVVADFTGDGLQDFLGVDVQGQAWLLAGTKGGEFSAEPSRPWKKLAEGTSAITAGDVDGDGDLDVWYTQYKIPYRGGQMPTPFYDANDGYPSFLFLNDGSGQFTDATKAAGLASKRHRRTYSASLVDIDDDRDLDLIVVSDFAGLDTWLNDGRGNFKEAPKNLFGEHHAFGMAHAFGHFDRDGREDLYMVGMSSTTARRLDQLGLKREDFPQHAKFRAPMAYGNRLYQARTGRYLQTQLNDHCARAGWAWGVTAFDVENDGDDDLYVANGHISGESATDYCTCFWRHDLYTGSSKENLAIEHLLTDRFRPESLRGLESGRISWNGFEHNRLFLNHRGQSFTDVGFPLGVSYESDCRSVVGADLDADGRQDLLVVDHAWVRTHGVAGKQALLVHRNVAPSGHWLAIQLQGNATCSPIGAKVTLHVKGSTRERRIVTGDSFYAQHPTVAHFGLGTLTAVEKVVVTWPNGKVSEWSGQGQKIDRYLTFQPPK